MNIFEMLSFDFKEFATSPAGILIIVGIICLLIGIVMFLKEDKKKPEEVKEEKPAEEPVKETATEAPAIVATPEVVTTPAVTPVVETVTETTPIVVPSEGDGVKEVSVAPVAETINFSETNAEAPVIEDIKPETLDIPKVEEISAEPVAPVVTPVVESLDSEPAAPTVYGGASPEVSQAEVLDDKPREIYGGANPLENTAPIPTVNASVEPVTETPVVTPVEPVTEAPVVEPVTEAPVVTPVEPVTEAPVVTPVEPVTEAPVVTPVETVEEKKEEIEKLEF